MKNYSKQREAILNALRSTDTHPTAAQVYAMVKKELPNISLGTVYRNLDALTQSGDILGISVGDGNTHFDGDSSHHLHLHCNKCGKISDFAAGFVTPAMKRKLHAAFEQLFFTIYIQHTPQYFHIKEPFCCKLFSEKRWNNFCRKYLSSALSIIHLQIKIHGNNTCKYSDEYMS